MIRLSKLYSSSEVPVSNVSSVAVGISEPSVDQRHLGLFFRINESESHQFIHLAFHHDLKVDTTPSPDCFWVVPELS